MNEQLGMSACKTTVNVGRDWLKGMGEAAAELGIDFMDTPVSGGVAAAAGARTSGGASG